MGQGGNRQWSQMCGRKTQISAKPRTGVTERERKACLGFGFFSAVFLWLINCPNEGEVLLGSRRESTSGRVGEKRVD